MESRAKQITLIIIVSNYPLAPIPHSEQSEDVKAHTLWSYRVSRFKAWIEMFESALKY
jgi:hypothetical protein